MYGIGAVCEEDGTMDRLIEGAKLYFPPITFHRLLVIEWLGEDDEKTGTELVRYLSNQKLDFPVDLISCRSRDDVFDGIARATNDVPKRGVPDRKSVV